MNEKKNLVLGFAKGYNWYILEPFIRSFVKNIHSADLILFIDDYSEFTYAQLEKVGEEIQGGTLKLEPVPDTLKERFPANSRWKVFADYIENHGSEYGQICISDTRDVVFQSDIFKFFEEQKNYIGYAEDFGDIGGKVCCGIHDWIQMAFGEDEARKLDDKVSVCPGVVIGTSKEIEVLLKKMWEYMPADKDFYGLDQALYVYLVYNNLVPVDNEIFISCHDGAILNTEWFHALNSIKLDGDFVLRGDGKIPAAIHQYDRHKKIADLVDKVYRVPISQPDKNFSDSKSLADQCLHLMQNDDAENNCEFLLNCLSKAENFSRHGNELIAFWKKLLYKKNFNAKIELLGIATQRAIISVLANGFYLNHGKYLCRLMDYCKKNNRTIVAELPEFVKKNSLKAVKFHLEKKNSNRYMRCLDLMARAGLTDSEYFYILRSEICLMINRKDLALIAQQDLLQHKNYVGDFEDALANFKAEMRKNLPDEIRR